MNDAMSTPSRVTHRDQEWYDAEIARKLQEELLATQVDMRAAQVAQDEEIARLLMAEEKKAYKKAREREKSSLEKRKHDPEWKLKSAKTVHPKSKESDEPHRSTGQHDHHHLPQQKLKIWSILILQSSTVLPVISQKQSPLIKVYITSSKKQESALKMDSL